MAFKKIPLILIAKLAPFLCEIPAEYDWIRETLIEESEAFLEHVKKYEPEDLYGNGTVSIHGLERTIRDYFHDRGDLRDFSIRKITFHDVRSG